jgi:hypothetical protein
MNINIPISIGEAIDKYAILIIKKAEIKDIEKLKDIDNEIAVIFPLIESYLIKYKYHYDCLYFINKEIWNLSDDVRNPHLSINIKNTLFLETFYKNDARYRIKSKLNKLTTSNLKEQKSYPDSTLILNPVDNIETYIEHNHYIRYLTLCYNFLIIKCYEHQYDILIKLFQDDPHIIIKIDIDTACITTIDLLTDNLPVPIPNLLLKYNFSNI